MAVLGAIVLGGLGGVTGMSVEMLARTATGPELAYAFRFVFLACALVLAFGMSFLIAMEQRPLKGPPSAGAEAPTAPATPIPGEWGLGKTPPRAQLERTTMKRPRHEAGVLDF